MLSYYFSNYEIHELSIPSKKGEFENSCLDFLNEFVND